MYRVEGGSRLALDISDEKAGWLYDELRPGEQITWACEPIPAWFTKDSVPMVAFGIPWTLFALFWTAGAASGVAQIEDGGAMGWLFRWAFPAFGLPFVFIGFGFLTAPFRQWRRLQRSVFATTDERALIIEHGLRNVREVRSIERRDIGAISKRVRGDGSGDVMFAVEHVPDSDSSSGTREMERGFVRVRDPRAAEDAIRALQARPE